MLRRRRLAFTPSSRLEPKVHGLGRFGKYFWQTVYQDSVVRVSERLWLIPETDAR
jgi:hypothetical protein